MNTIKKFFGDETGLELSEYAIAAGIVVAVAIGLFTSIGDEVEKKINALLLAVKG
jgi:pilus assembly protein Flp/PilA